MTKLIYGVALNGTSPVTAYPVLLETAKTYTISRPIGSIVRKATMSDRWERYFTNEDEAKKFLTELRKFIEKSNRRLDVQFVYNELVAVLDENDTARKIRLKNLAKYLEAFL